MFPAATSQDQRSMKWYNDDIKEVPTDIRKLFEVCSGISPENVVSHVLEIVCLSYMLTDYHDFVY